MRNRCGQKKMCSWFYWTFCLCLRPLCRSCSCRVHLEQGVSKKTDSNVCKLPPRGSDQWLEVTGHWTGEESGKGAATHPTLSSADAACHLIGKCCVCRSLPVWVYKPGQWEECEQPGAAAWGPPHLHNVMSSCKACVSVTGEFVTMFKQYCGTQSKTGNVEVS